MKKIKGFIIHLERAYERHKQVEKLQKSLPFETVILKAIDSQKLDFEKIHKVYKRKTYRPFYPFDLSKNEIACFLSHRKAWQCIVDEGLEAGFVIEDDVQFDESFLKALSFGMEHLNESSCMRFPFREREAGKTLFSHNGFRLIEPIQVGLGQVAQLIGRDAAIKLLKSTEIFDRPVDTSIQLFWQTGVRPSVVLPPCVSEISAQLGGSTIKSKISFFARLYREIARPIYRNKIAALSRKKGK